MKERKQAGHPGRLDTPGTDVVLPAEGYTVATSLAGQQILIAHTGGAHLGLVIDRAFRRRLRRAYAAASTSRRARALTHLTYESSDDAAPVIRFRHATEHQVRVAGGTIHVVLGAVGEPGKPDVHVELRLRHECRDP
ncbi:MAG TPA: hypothetical protein VD859_12075 [Nocardioides sp.]|nr:hypothetical protein [Nocardioides sp.]